MILTTHDKARRALSQLMNDYDKDDKADPVKFRNVVHAFSILLSYYKLEKDLSIEDDITEIKEILKAQGLMK